jgi:glycosyltransferase involved in cell wall biosynthesis
MARILVIRQLYFPRDAKARREVEALRQAGHSVDVLCLRRPDEPMHERTGGVDIWRMPIKHRRGRLLGYVLEYTIIFVLTTVIAAALHVRRRFDVIQVNTPPDSIVFAAIVPRLFGARVLLQLQEPMPEFFSTKFGVPATDLRVRLVAWIEQASIRFADFAITCTDHMRQAFVARGAEASKVGVVVPASNEDEFNPDRTRAIDHQEGQFVLLSHGSIEERYGLDTAIRAIRLVRDDIPGIRLEIYGEGFYTERLKEIAREESVTDLVAFHGWVPIEELVQAIADADAGVVAMKRDAFRDLTHCLKMYDFVSMRRPAIVSRTLSVDDYFGDAVFEKFRADDPADLARAIRALRSDDARATALVARATEAIEPYRWVHQRRFYLDTIDWLVSGRRGSSPVLSQQLSDPKATRL